MPKLLNSPPNAVIICHIRICNPLQNSIIITLRPLTNPLPRKHKLRTALMPNILRDLTYLESKKLP